jgi:hypothetical protein
MSLVAVCGALIGLTGLFWVLGIRSFERRALS